MESILQSILSSPQYSRSIPRRNQQFCEIYRKKKKYSQPYQPRYKQQPVSLPPIFHQQIEGRRKPSFNFSMDEKEQFATPDRMRKIEITSKVVYYLNRMVHPENASKTKSYRDKEVKSSLAPGINAYEGIYDEMYID